MKDQQEIICYELRHEEKMELMKDSVLRRTLSDDELKAMEAKLASMLHCTWDPDEYYDSTDIVREKSDPLYFRVGSLFGPPLSHLIILAPCTIVTVASDNLALAKSDAQAVPNPEPVPRLAEVRCIPLPGKTHYSCIVMVDPFYGILVSAKHKDINPLEIRANWVHDNVANIDAVFPGSELEQESLRIALFQFGDCYARPN